MNTYGTSNGERLTTPEIERRIRQAIKMLLEIQFIDYGYNFCEHCKSNEDKPIDVSHTISRKKAKEEGRAEMLWDLGNLEILGRKCHKIKDKLI